LPFILLLSIMSGLMAAFVAHEARPTFYDRRALSEATGLPILGAVSQVVSEPNRIIARRSNIRFMFTTSLLVVAGVAVYTAFTLSAIRIG
jgi:hypothetical protein